MNCNLIIINTNNLFISNDICGKVLLSRFIFDANSEQNY